MKPDPTQELGMFFTQEQIRNSIYEVDSALDLQIKIEQPIARHSRNLNELKNNKTHAKRS